MFHYSTQEERVTTLFSNTSLKQLDTERGKVSCKIPWRHLMCMTVAHWNTPNNKQTHTATLNTHEQRFGLNKRSPNYRQIIWQQSPHFPPKVQIQLHRTALTAPTLTADWAVHEVVATVSIECNNRVHLSLRTLATSLSIHFPFFAHM